MTEPSTIILASKSPRRHQLLQAAGFDFEIVTKDTAEIIDPQLAIAQVPLAIARQKAVAIADLVRAQDVVITADTIVTIDNEILGKPVNSADAHRMLALLSGRQHQVITGVCLQQGDRQHTFGVSTTVVFRPLSKAQIGYYIDHFQPFDKAGAYAIQEWIGMIGIESIEGCYYNVVGLPVGQLCIELSKFASESSTT